MTIKELFEIQEVYDPKVGKMVKYDAREHLVKYGSVDLIDGENSITIYKEYITGIKI